MLPVGLGNGTLGAEAVIDYLFENVNGEEFLRHTVHRYRTGDKDKAVIFRWNRRTSHYAVEVCGQVITQTDLLVPAVLAYNEIEINPRSKQNDSVATRAFTG